MNLANKSAVITGASVGLGYVIARRFAAEGAKVCICARNIDAIERAAAEIRAAIQAEVLSAAADVSHRSWPASMPTAIIVSAAAPEFPRTLFEQLREGGRVVVPVGPIDCQQLELITKEAGSPVVTREVACRFVPLIGEKGYSSE